MRAIYNKTNNGWIKIESENWLKEHKIDGSRTKYYVDNIDEDYLTIAVKVVYNDEELIMTLSDYYFIKEEVKPTHYQPIKKPQPPIY